MKGNRATVLVAVKDVGLEVNAKKTKHVLPSCQVNHHVRIANKILSECGVFKCWGTNNMKSKSHKRRIKSSIKFIHQQMLSLLNLTKF